MRYIVINKHWGATFTFYWFYLEVGTVLCHLKPQQVQICHSPCYSECHLLMAHCWVPLGTVLNWRELTPQVTPLSLESTPYSMTGQHRNVKAWLFLFSFEISWKSHSRFRSSHRCGRFCCNCIAVELLLLPNPASLTYWKSIFLSNSHGGKSWSSYQFPRDVTDNTLFLSVYYKVKESESI